MSIEDLAIIQHLLPSDPSEVSPIVGMGEVNRVYYVRCSDAELVIRLNESTSLDRFQKEAWCLDQARCLGIPSPHVVTFGVIEQVAYMVLDYIRGVQATAIPDRVAVWSTLGAYAKRFHSLPIEGFGETLSAPGVFDGQWQTYLGENLASMSPEADLVMRGILSPSQARELSQDLEYLRHECFQFGLVHGDISLKNVLVSGEEVFLIDWGCAEAAIVPHHELIALKQNAVVPSGRDFVSFLQGYGMTREVYEGLMPDVRRLEKVQALDKLRWALDKKPERIAAFTNRLYGILRSP
jgi:tRNA A-37 threonylcarbamoyl transferase component Bud32